MNPHRPLPVLLLAFAWVLTGCAAHLTYTPRYPLAGPPLKEVSLEVLNERPPHQGGDDVRAVGIARGGYGNPMRFREQSPDAVPRLVTEATVDALHAVGVGVHPGAPNRLRARLLTLWMDGYIGYGANVVIEYALLDAENRVLWTQRAQGAEGGAVFSFGAASELISQALANAAGSAVALFRDPAFHAALR